MDTITEDKYIKLEVVKTVLTVGSEVDKQNPLPKVKELVEYIMQEDSKPATRRTRKTNSK